jgi:hypothetical protein
LPTPTKWSTGEPGGAVVARCVGVAGGRVEGRAAGVTRRGVGITTGTGAGVTIDGVTIGGGDTGTAGAAAGRDVAAQPVDSTTATVAAVAEIRRITPRRKGTPRTLTGIAAAEGANVRTRRPSARAGACAGAALALVAVTGCLGAPGHIRRADPPNTVRFSTPTVSDSPTPTVIRTPKPTPKATPKSTPPTPPAGVPRFTSSVETVTAASLGKSWRSGCPVGPDGLRALTLTYWGFDARPHTGTLIVATAAVPAMTEAWRQMYAARFPVRKVIPISAYGGDDNRSMAADNTSAFNCRYAVADGPKHWSAHAYGQAVDIDPYENPYTLDGRVYPPGATTYTHRSNVRPGMIVPGSAPVRAFSAVGWGWGGRWSSSPDYQHFSASGG